MGAGRGPVVGRGTGPGRSGRSCRAGRDRRRQPRPEPATARLPQFRRQVVERHRRPIGQDDGPLQDVFQLADVARPVVSHQGLDRLGVEVRDQLAGPLRVEVQEVDGQLENVLAALAQGRVRAGRSR